MTQGVVHERTDDKWVWHPVVDNGRTVTVGHGGRPRERADDGNWIIGGEFTNTDKKIVNSAMEPLYDVNVNLVGWIDPGQHIFDTNLDWAAYVSGGDAWSSNSGNWCGPVNGTTCLDRNGNPVAWSPRTPPSGSMRPMRPMRPMRAMRPLRPMRPMTPMRPMKPMPPMGGWSQQSFAEWIAGE
jgi:hypothetical protein